MKKNASKRNVLITILCIFLTFFILVYLGFSIYFSKHFFFNTKINGIDVSFMNTEKTEELLAKEWKKYQLQIKGRNHVTGIITAHDINLEYLSNNRIEQFLQEQNSFLWFRSFFSRDEKEISNCVTYDKQKLEEVIKSLPFFQKENKIAPTNAHIIYDESEGYIMINETQGAVPVFDLVQEKILSYINSNRTELSLEKEDCYKKPAITSEHPALVDLYEKLSLYNNTFITYKFGKKTEVVDIHRIKDWLKINPKKFKVKIEKDKVRAFVDYIGKTYNTFGKTRTFKASTGNEVTVSGGDYGWLLDREKETTQLIKLIKKGAEKTKKPSYFQKAASYSSKDWGNTYVEINLTAQHIWYYKKGKLIAESDFVSGNLARGWDTPQGVYDITYIERDVILGVNSNASYRTPVSFWMPFNGNIGLHDATWRSKFGGTIYKTNGSHGCVNLPYNTAKTIYENISAGVPVICYYDPAYTTETTTDNATKSNTDAGANNNSNTEANSNSDANNNSNTDANLNSDANNDSNAEVNSTADTDNEEEQAL